MRLYHGSNTEIDAIDLSKSKPGKDFGRGFYLSDTESQAMEMALFKAEQFGGIPIVTVFEFDENKLRDPEYKKIEFDDYSPEWVDFIIANRTGKETERYDFVYGPIAEDKVGRQLRRFFDKDIDKNELIERLKYFKGISFQYFFGTEKSLELLRKVNEKDG